MLLVCVAIVEGVSLAVIDKDFISSIAGSAVIDKVTAVNVDEYASTDVDGAILDCSGD